MDTKLIKLRRFNMIMGGLHLLQGILMLFLASTVIQKLGEFQPMITQNFLQYNMTTQSLELASKELFQLPFGVFVSIFLLLSAGAHALISIPNKLNQIYNSDLQKGINKFRWFEYALSSSVMIVLIATLFGIYDIASLVLIFVVNASMNLFGLVMEQLNAKRAKSEKINWGPFIWGAFAGIAPWVAILLYMFGNANFDQVPWFVWAIVGTYFVAFNTFPVNMILQYKKVRKWKDYLYGERTYIVLSLVAKSILAWLVLFGAMQP
ncbi:MAG: heliorhodopsin HeR [Candidatus Izemoplasmatales bacterium]|jgi:ABC-type multidrug transport system fused ATPase/permease subunit|nr:heliorhodopsin HeR [Candidatus Izemoplasmatales bacterium]